MEKLDSRKIPLAFVMKAAADRVRPRRDGRHPVEKYFLLWTAFSTIYSTIASEKGLKTELVLKEDGAVSTCWNGSVQIPEVNRVSERQQLYTVLDELDASLTHRLITHESIAFFVRRTPFWQGKKVSQDAFGQRLNGVLDVGDTTSAEYPVWSPLDSERYGRYVDNPEDEETRDFLVRQIVDLLFTVRRNLVQVGSVFDDANDIAVFENGLPLVEMLVSSFMA